MNQDFLDRIAAAAAKPQTESENTKMTIPIAPAGIGIAINPALQAEPKQIMTRLATEFPVDGLEPEQRAQLRMAAKLTNKAAEDAEFYTKQADSIGGSMARIHTANVNHLGNFMQHDLKVKAADVEHIGNLESWQEKTLTLLEKARERHAGIRMLQACI